MAKSMKEQNRTLLAGILAANIGFLYVALTANGFSLEGMSFPKVSRLMPVGAIPCLAIALTTILNAHFKAVIVYWRLKDPLPGARAFSMHVYKDPRIDPRLLERSMGRLPSDPGEQNRVWYRLLKGLEGNAGIAQSHREVLLLRDYAALTFILALASVATPWLANSPFVAKVYMGCMLAQYMLARLSAAVAGVRLVANVLALTCTRIRSENQL